MRSERSRLSSRLLRDRAAGCAESDRIGNVRARTPVAAERCDRRATAPEATKEQESGMWCRRWYQCVWPDAIPLGLLAALVFSGHRGRRHRRGRSERTHRKRMPLSGGAEPIAVLRVCARDSVCGRGSICAAGDTASAVRGRRAQDLVAAIADGQRDEREFSCAAAAIEARRRATIARGSVCQGTSANCNGNSGSTSTSTCTCSSSSEHVRTGGSVRLERAPAQFQPAGGEPVARQVAAGYDQPRPSRARFRSESESERHSRRRRLGLWLWLGAPFLLVHCTCTCACACDYDSIR